VVSAERPRASEAFVSVVVPVRNAEGSIGEFLATLAAQTLPRERFEVIVVDDASTDRTGEAARASGTATVLRTATWSGAYGARNVGLRAARGEVIALTDADCRPRPHWLEAALEDLDALGADLVGGHVDVPLAERPSIAELVDFAHYLDQERGLREAGFAVTANLVVRRAVLDRVGPFLERPISDGDRELCLRAQEAGFVLAYSRRAEVWHPPRTRMRELSRRAFRDGYGLAQMKREGGRHAERVPLVWRRLGAYAPRRLMTRGGSVYGIERIHAAGYRPTRSELVRMELAEWLCHQLPMNAGNLAGWLRERS
jgi:glycosyltransferase involved in cell wall biosynthesis